MSFGKCLGFHYLSKSQMILLHNLNWSQTNANDGLLIMVKLSEYILQYAVIGSSNFLLFCFILGFLRLTFC